MNTLLDRGAAIHQRNNFGEEALRMAVQGRQVCATGALLARLVRGGEEIPENMLQPIPSAGIQNLLETLLKNTRLDPGVSESVAEALIRLYYNE